MRAIRMHRPGDPDVLRLEEVPDPTPGAGEVLIAVAAAGVNYADLAVRQFGGHPGGPPPPPPLTPGFEVAGTIAAVGAGVAGLAVGDRVGAVLDAGGYAEYAVAEAAKIMPIPDGVDFATATAFLIQGPTAHGVLHDAVRLRAGESVLVEAAAGGVGHLAVQLAKLAGAQPVLGAAGSAEKRELARQLGADRAIDYTPQDWAAEVREATGGRGVDVVLEAVGGPVGAVAVECLAPLGRLVIFGAASGQPAPLPNPMALNMKGLTVSGFGGPWIRPGRAAAAREELFAHLRAGRLRVVLGPSFPLAEAAAAHRAVGSRQTVGKVVLLTGAGREGAA